MIKLTGIKVQPDTTKHNLCAHFLSCMVHIVNIQNLYVDIVITLIHISKIKQQCNSMFLSNLSFF